MKKILLDFGVTKDQEQVQTYLGLVLNFPEHYGKNLDALYDCLTDITEDTCIGVFGTTKVPEISKYLYKVKTVLRDAEAENPHLLVIFGDLAENYEGNEGL